VGALGHYLEAAGIPTTQISLVREHTVALAPPRALWVPFMLGRPFGAPNDAPFQTQVLLTALQLFEREAGPVLEDFAHDAPHQQLTPPPQNLACPVSFPRLQATDEVAVRHRGRTTLGVTGLPPAKLATYLGQWLGPQPPQPFRSDITPGVALKQACDELKAFYLEAKSVQPGTHTAASMQDWFWHNTALGRAIVQIRGIAARCSEPTVKAVAVQSLIPRAVERTLTPEA
jgi:hypothetical protein